MFKAIKNFLAKKETLEDKVKKLYNLSLYDLHRQRAMFDYRNNNNKYKTHDEFLNYILLFGLFDDYSKDLSASNKTDYNYDYSSYDSYSSSSSSSYDTCSSSSSSD